MLLSYTVSVKVEKINNCEEAITQISIQQLEGLKALFVQCYKRKQDPEEFVLPQGRAEGLLPASLAQLRERPALSPTLSYCTSGGLWGHHQAQGVQTTQRPLQKP